MSHAPVREDRTFTAQITEEDGTYVAQCWEVDVVSQGETIEEALANIAEAVGLYLECMEEEERPVRSRMLTVSQFQVPLYA